MGQGRRGLGVPARGSITIIVDAEALVDSEVAEALNRLILALAKFEATTRRAVVAPASGE